MATMAPSCPRMGTNQTPFFYIDSNHPQHQDHHFVCMNASSPVCNFMWTLHSLHYFWHVAQNFWSKSFEWQWLYASWQYVTMLKTEVVAGGWWVGWGKNTHLTFLRDRTPTLYSAHLLHTHCLLCHNTPAQGGRSTALHEHHCNGIQVRIRR